MRRSRIAMLTAPALFLVAGALCPTAHAGTFDASSPMVITRVELTAERPAGLGRVTGGSDSFAKDGGGFYIYIEADNCRLVKDASAYRGSLAMDIDLYYEDGTQVYSEKDAGVAEYRCVNPGTKAFIATRFDPSYLKAGEYKMELTVKDGISGKDAFIIKMFNIT